MFVDGFMAFSVIQLKTYSNNLLQVSLSDIFKLAILEIKSNSVSYILISYSEGSNICYFFWATIAAISLWFALLILYSSIDFSNVMKSNFGFNTWDSTDCPTLSFESYFTWALCVCVSPSKDLHSRNWAAIFLRCAMIIFSSDFACSYSDLIVYL